MVLVPGRIPQAISLSKMVAQFSQCGMAGRRGKANGVRPYGKVDDFSNVASDRDALVAMDGQPGNEPVKIRARASSQVMCDG